MIIDLVDKIIDRSIQLFNYYKDSRHNLFNNYVEPIYSNFESLHKEYLASFQKYREIVKSSKEPLNSDHPILDSIKRDILFTTDQRSKLMELSRFFELPFEGRPFGQEIYNFVYLIRNYLIRPQNRDLRNSFEGSEYFQTYEQSYVGIGDQRFRYILLDSLKKIFESQGPPDEFKRGEALRVLDSIVGEMQIYYSRITREYYNLKGKLLV